MVEGQFQWIFRFKSQSCNEFGLGKFEFIGFFDGIEGDFHVTNLAIIYLGSDFKLRHFKFIIILLN